MNLLPLFGFVFVGLFSPGPNVILLTASGARFGFRRTVPHIIGVAIGVGVTASVTGLGMGHLLGSQPNLSLLLRILACIWILWMAYGLWRSAPRATEDAGRPFTFIEAVLFQWVNPKVWAVAASASQFPADLPPIQLGLLLGATFLTINSVVCTFWTAVGQGLGRFLSAPVAWRIFTRTMALLLAVFAGLVFL